MRIEYHRTLIADRVRNDAFFAALKTAIVPGQTVVADIGAGTGLLGLMASRLGAKEVFLFETAEVAAVAAEVLKVNRAKNCHLIPCHSTEFGDRLQADLIVSETLGNYALEENIIATLADARRRFLKRGGVIIPRAIRQLVAPVTSDRVDRELRVWGSAAEGIDFSPAQTMSLNNAYVRLLKQGDLLDDAKGVEWDRIDLTRETRSARRGSAKWRVHSRTEIFGLALWWMADLVPGVSLSTGPGAPRTHWEQLYLPLLTPLQLAANHRLEVEISSRCSEKEGTHISWRVSQRGARGQTIATQNLDLDKGFLP